MTSIDATGPAPGRPKAGPTPGRGGSSYPANQGQT